MKRPPMMKRSSRSLNLNHGGYQKARRGHPLNGVCRSHVVEDQVQFILGHEVIWEGGDQDMIVACLRRLQEHEPQLRALRLDEGFWRPAV